MPVIVPLVSAVNLTPSSMVYLAQDAVLAVGVTGVQACALPISPEATAAGPVPTVLVAETVNVYAVLLVSPVIVVDVRSEERRVGKECRAGGAPGQSKKKVMTWPLAQRGFQRIRAGSD